MNKNYKSEVWVTGFGIVSALGKGVNSHIHAIKNLKTGLKPNFFFDGKKPDPVISGLISKKILKSSIEDVNINRSDLIIDIAVNEALKSLPNNSLKKIQPKNIDLIIGTTLGNMYAGSSYYLQHRKGLKGKHSLVKGFLSNSPSDFISKKYNFSGYKMTLSQACASGISAIIQGVKRIQSKRSKFVIAGGVDALSPFIISGFHSLKLLSKHPCKPFDKNRNGLNPAEGSAVLILENSIEAKKRGVKPYAIIKGYGEALEAYHQTRSNPEGIGVQNVIKKSLNSKNTNVDFIHLHGTATIFNDLSEYNGIYKVFGKSMKNIYTTSTKSMTGHTFGASGSIGAVFSILALNKKIIPPTLNHTLKDPHFKYLNISNKYKSLKEVNHTMTLSLGFGGEIAALLFGKNSHPAIKSRDDS